MSVGLPPGRDSILEPLCFPEPPPGSCPSPGSAVLACLFCPESVPDRERDELLRHLLVEHKLVIAEVQMVADLSR